MRFSTKTEYGLRAMAQLAKNYGKTPLSLANIAKTEKISQPYLERLIAKLKSAKLVKSTKGARGGYCLIKKPKEISLLEIIEALEGPIVIYRCLVGNNMICANKVCLTKKVWSKVQSKIIKVLEQTKLSQII